MKCAFEERPANSKQDTHKHYLMATGAVRKTEQEKWAGRKVKAVRKTEHGEPVITPITRGQFEGAQGPLSLRTRQVIQVTLGSGPLGSSEQG